MTSTKLFSPLQIGQLRLAHRIVMAPLTRMRADPTTVKPAVKGVRQEPPLPVQVELADGVAPDPALAAAMVAKVREVLIATIRVELVPFGTLARSEYKTKLLDFTGAAEAPQ